MEKLVFQPSEESTIGVELELALVDADTFALSSSIGEVIGNLPECHTRDIKPELMQCCVEIATGVCSTVAEVEEDLRRKLVVLEGITDNLGLKLYWTGTHPFSRWQDQSPAPNERYERLLKILQDTGRRLVTFGLHVHVGVDSGDKAVMICDRIMRHLPTLLALSCNSPWWNNRLTGLHSNRSKIMEGLPTAGLPSLMRNWSEYVWLVNHMIETGFINSIRDLWWDVRPHYNFGTVEVRVCDMPGNLEDALAIAALIQSLVRALSDEIDQGAYQHDCHPMMVRQNKWRAARYGLGAQLVDTYTHTSRPARQVVTDLTGKLRPVAEQLGCLHYLENAAEMARRPSWSQRQLDAFRGTGDLKAMIQIMTGLSRMSASTLC